MWNTTIWADNQIYTSITSRILVTTDEDECPAEEQPFPPTIKIIQRLIPLWEHSFHDWAQILCRGLYGRPYFLDDRELRWANPTMRNPLPQPLRAVLTYLRALFSSTNPDQWDKLKRDIKSTPLWDLPIAQRWRQILEEDWTTIPITPSPLALDRATRQQSITSALTGKPHTPAGGQLATPAKITLHFPSPR
jgi:hypothetical protein